jgi:hypothetical protein
MNFDGRPPISGNRRASEVDGGEPLRANDNAHQIAAALIAQKFRDAGVSCELLDPAPNRDTLWRPAPARPNLRRPCPLIADRCDVEFSTVALHRYAHGCHVSNRIQFAREFATKSPHRSEPLTWMPQSNSTADAQRWERRGCPVTSVGKEPTQKSRTGA